MRRVTAFDGTAGIFTLDPVCLGRSKPGTRYELASGEDAPLLAIRQVLGLSLDQPLPPLVVKLGTTRGTNALLTRTGARTAFVTTRGFADVLKIANQDRPRLFDLEIHKPEPLFAAVVEIDERLDAFGAVLRAPRLDEVRESLARLAGRRHRVLGDLPVARVCQLGSRGVGRTSCAGGWL